MRQPVRVVLLPVVAALAACSAPPSNTFAPFDAAPTANAKLHKNCALDTVDTATAGPTIEVKRGKPVVFSGWLTDDALHAPKEFTLVLTGTKTFARKVPTGVGRSDVAQAMGSLAASTSGFALHLDFGPVAAGSYLASTVQMTNAGSLVCQFNKIIVVSD